MSTLEALRTILVRSVGDPDMPDLSQRQLAVLLCLEEAQEPLTIRGLADTLKAPKPSITRAVDRLETEEFAERRDDASDRRSVNIVITAGGRRFLKKLAR